MDLTELIEHLGKPDRRQYYSVATVLLQRVVPVLTALGWDVTNTEGHGDVECRTKRSGNGASSNVRLWLYSRDHEFDRHCLADVEVVTSWEPRADLWSLPPKFNARVGVRTDGHSWQFHHQPADSHTSTHVSTVRVGVLPAATVATQLTELLDRQQLTTGRTLATLQATLRQRAERPPLNPLVKLVKAALEANVEWTASDETAGLVSQVVDLYRLDNHTHQELLRVIGTTEPPAPSPQPVGRQRSG